MTQNQLLLHHFDRAGSITAREAMIDYSIQCLTKRIQELRELGYIILTQFKKHPTTGQRYARYILNKSPKNRKSL